MLLKGAWGADALLGGGKIALQGLEMCVWGKESSVSEFF